MQSVERLPEIFPVSRSRLLVLRILCPIFTVGESPLCCRFSFVCGLSAFFCCWVPVLGSRNYRSPLDPPYTFDNSESLSFGPKLLSAAAVSSWLLITERFIAAERGDKLGL